jgi:hypothetical protein
VGLSIDSSLGLSNILLAVGDEFGCNSRFIFNCAGVWRGEMVLETDLVFERLGLLGDVFVCPTRPFQSPDEGAIDGFGVEIARPIVEVTALGALVGVISKLFLSRADCVWELPLEVSRIEAQTGLISGRTTVVIMRSGSLGSGDSSRRASMSRYWARESAFVFPVSRLVRDCGGSGLGLVVAARTAVTTEARELAWR